MGRNAWLLVLVAIGCAEPAPTPAPVRFWHTFSAREAEALAPVLEEIGDVQSTLVPFGRAQTLFDAALRRGDCPDLARIDATWLPGLVAAGLLRPAPVPDSFEERLLPEAAALGSIDGALYGVPQALDGLALIHRRDDALPPIATLADLDAVVASADLEVRVDGYWWLAFLRAAGGDLFDPATGALGIDRPAAAAALARFAAIARRPGGAVVALDGPWSAYDRSGGEPDRLAVAPFPRAPDGRAAAPLGGQLLVFPACAPPLRGPARSRIIVEVTLALLDPVRQAAWSRRFGTVPTTRAGLAAAGRFATEFHAALAAARPLPRHPLTPELFDDLTPAIEAVVAGDATAEEALAGVARGWRRLAARHGVAIREAPP